MGINTSGLMILIHAVIYMYHSQMRHHFIKSYFTQLSLSQESV